MERKIVQIISNPLKTMKNYSCKIQLVILNLKTYEYTDFIIDADYEPWLIEVNTNPCLEESSQLLKVFLPRMIEDMLKLTMDQVFPKKSIRKAKK